MSVVSRQQVGGVTAAPATPRRPGDTHAVTGSRAAESRWGPHWSPGPPDRAPGPAMGPFGSAGSGLRTPNPKIGRQEVCDGSDARGGRAVPREQRKVVPLSQASEARHGAAGDPGRVPCGP